MTTIQTVYDRFSKERFPLPSEAQLSTLEQQLRIVFPDDYRQFILEYNGGYFKCPEITPASGVGSQYDGGRRLRFRRSVQARKTTPRKSIHRCRPKA